ncbi:MAG: hypothetical protein EBU73_07840, partial [Chitinophagia bacterium]|nr:hypothetical protein [Chitinophagia bacterium]
MNPKLSIEIWSDIVCPFCYIGKMKLEQALRNLNALDRVEITWRSFQLDPQFPKHTSMSSAEHLSSKTGIPADRLSNMRRSAGIPVLLERCSAELIEVC